MQMTVVMVMIYGSMIDLRKSITKRIRNNSGRNVDFVPHILHKCGVSNERLVFS